MSQTLDIQMKLMLILLFDSGGDRKDMSQCQSFAFKKA